MDKIDNKEANNNILKVKKKIKTVKHNSKQPKKQSKLKEKPFPEI